MQETETFQVNVKLTVTADVVAAQSTWGSGAASKSCADIASTFDTNVTAIVGDLTTLEFTLCDFEGLQVASFYAAFQGRSFSAVMRQIESALTTTLNVSSNFHRARASHCVC